MVMFECPNSHPLGWIRVREGMGWNDYCPDHAKHVAQ